MEGGISNCHPNVHLGWKTKHMGKGRIVLKKNLTKKHTDTYWIEVKGSPVKSVPLNKSRLVKQSPRSKRSSGKIFDKHLQTSARVSPDSGGVLQRGIQLHRHWFQFLKLALELESMGVDAFVTKQTRVAKGEGGGAGNLKYQLKDTVEFKVKRDKYDGWDLDQVLTETFNTWWKTHNHLFEGYAPSFTTPQDKQNPDDFLYIRIDKSSKLEDVREFITGEVKDRLNGTPKFQIQGYPRPDKLQNAYNALVYTLNPVVDGVEVNAEGFMSHKNIYLRATDIRSDGDRLNASSYTDKKTGRTKTQWGAGVGRQRDVGIHHLLNVMNGKFGDLPDKGVG